VVDFQALNRSSPNIAVQLHPNQEIHREKDSVVACCSVPRTDDERSAARERERTHLPPGRQVRVVD